jgi:pimeloyl-ACP methyl ester carboxylesterase
MVGRSRQSFLVEQRALLAETPEIERSLCRIAVPTAVLTGASDRVVPVSAARSLAVRVPGAELVVIAGGHLLPFDQPEKIAEVVRRYSALASGVRDGQRRRERPGA